MPAWCVSLLCSWLGSEMEVWPTHDDLHLDASLPSLANSSMVAYLGRQQKCYEKYLWCCALEGWDSWKKHRHAQLNSVESTLPEDSLEAFTFTFPLKEKAILLGCTHLTGVSGRLRMKAFHWTDAERRSVLVRCFLLCCVRQGSSLLQFQGGFLVWIATEWNGLQFLVEIVSSQHVLSTVISQKNMFISKSKTEIW